MSWDPGGVTYSDTDPTLGPPITRLGQPARAPQSPRVEFVPAGDPLLRLIDEVTWLRAEVAACRAEVYHRSLEGVCARAWAWVTSLVRV